MIKAINILLFLILATSFCCCKRQNSASTTTVTDDFNSIYYWKTTFRIDSVECKFLHRHNIRRIYLRMFDVVVEQNHKTGTAEIVPVATTKFLSKVPCDVEIVPVTYVTIEALRAMSGKECEFAPLIVDRLLAMSSYNECGEIKEVQIDCDWTKTTKDSYKKLCQIVKDSLQRKNIGLSITVRLHQLKEDAPPANRGVLMLYNTGALKNPETKNSILDIADVQPYLKSVEYAIPLDYAYPAFGWGVMFEDYKFVRIISATDSSATARGKLHIRYERPTANEILSVKKLVEQNLGKPACGNILYHLDTLQLKHYTDNEISQFFSR